MQTRNEFGGGTAMWRVSRRVPGMSLLCADAVKQPFPRHVHSNWVIGVVKSGRVLLRTAQDEMVLGAGEILLVPPLLPHDEIPDAPHGYALRYFYIPDAAARHIAGAAHSLVPRTANTFVNDDLARRLLDLADRGRSEPFPDQDAARVFAQAIDGCSALHRRDRTHDHVERVVRVINHAAQCGEKLASMAALAAVTGISRFRLTRLFSSQMGLPPYAYYEQVRVARARELLISGASLSRIAATLGYSDQSHFTRKFARTATITPGAYRRLLADHGTPASSPAT